MAFLEEYVEMMILPTMNDHLKNKLMLGEFYKWLGCNFFMACFRGIKELVLMFDRAPFYLNAVLGLI